MANTDRPTGLTPIRTTQGKPNTGQVTTMAFVSADGTAAFKGDLVKLSGTANSDGLASVAQSAAGDVSVGVIVDFEPDRADLTVLHRVASTDREVLVCTDREMLYEIQDDSVGGDLAITNIGNTADVIVGAGSTVSGLSGMELDSSDADANAGQLLIMELVQRPDNVIGTNAKILVKIVEHQFDVATGV